MRSEWDSLPEAAAEIGLDAAAIPLVARRKVGAVSVVLWGDAPPDLVLLHGGGQNARTWDLVVLALGRPVLAVDLPGHGRSDWRGDSDYSPARNADAVAAVLDEVAPGARAAVGMSLGGLTAIRLAAVRPDLVSRLAVVDVTPSVLHRVAAMTTEQRGAAALSGEPEYFDSIEEMVVRAVRASPRRPASAVRRGVVNNARQLPDGRWRWRYDVAGLRTIEGSDHTPLWEDVAALTVPVMLVRGGESAFVTGDDLTEFRHRVPSLWAEVVPGSGHAVQSDRPAELAVLLMRFLDS